MAPRYLVQLQHRVRTEDLPALPDGLVAEFWDTYAYVLTVDPKGCSGYPSHDLRGRLTGYRALEIDFEDTPYRLVYRVCDSPAPKRVEVVSFDVHDSAYEKAVERLGKN